MSTLRRLLSSIGDNVLICLMNLNLVEQVGRRHLHHVVPNVNSQVLRRADNVGKVRDVLIQVFMVQWSHDDVLDALLQVRQVHDHAGHTIDLSSDCDLHFVVVSVTIGIVAFPVDFLILLVTQVNAVEAVTGAEALDPGEVSDALRGGSSHGRYLSEERMDVQESAGDMENNQNQEIDMEGRDSSHDTHLPKIYQGAIGDVNLYPRVVLGERCRSGHDVHEDADWLKTKRAKPPTKGPAAPTKSAVQTKSLANRHDVPIFKTTTMAEYKRTMEAKAKSAAIPRGNHLTPSLYTSSEKSYPLRQRLNNIPVSKETVQHKKQEGKKKKTAVIKTNSGYSCRGFMRYLCCLVLLVLLSSAALLAYKKVPVLRRTAERGGHSYRAVKPEMFADQLSLLKAQFPNQHLELWKRSKMHLEKHLQTAQPTEPVSLIFTAGRKAERTLRCLAQGLASSFSSALNASVLHIDGASKANQDSDEVKLDIDSQLKAAFEGDKPVAVIHRLEELPPGSTLIFYRYCDHESAAYKQVFLLFTVLLPQDEVSNEQPLKDVEEMVHDYVKERLVGSSSQTAFNEMDTDKYGGLWSRISHLILPVVSEEEVEQKGC